MFTWFKNLFGKRSEPLILTNPIKYEDEVKVKVTERPSEPKPTKTKAQKPKKSATKETKIDVDSMNKTQLLAEAKRLGIKANASMNKAEILAAIKG